MNVNWKIHPLLCGAAMIAGCAHYQPEPLRPEKLAAQFDARRLDDPGLEEFLATNSQGTPAAWPLEKWDLNSLTLAAFYFHPELAVARAQWRLAEAGVRTAGARPNPSVSFSPGYDNQIPNNPSPWIFPVTFDIPIETAGKRGKRIAEAQKAAESARWSFVSAAWQVRGGVRAALLDFSLAGRRAGLLEKEFEAQTNIVALLQGQYDAGAIARPDLTLAEIALHKTQLDLSDARSKRSEALSRLAQAIGVSRAALEGLKMGYDFSAMSALGRDGVEAPTSSAARSVALRQRADILGSLADYAAAEAALQVEIARQYPDLHLGPAYAWNTGSAGDNEWSLGATLELPILDQNEGPIAEAEARRKLAAAKFMALQAQVCGEIDSAVAAVRVASGQLQIGEKLLEAERRQLKSAEAQLQAGAAERQDLFNAQLESANTALTQLDNEEKLQTALADLEDAIQSPADQIATLIEKISTEDAKGRQP